MAIKRGVGNVCTVGGGQASVDGVLEYAGVSHPSVATHFLATLGVLLVSIGALHTGALLPMPLYGCWGALTLDDVPRRVSCQGYNLLSPDSVNPYQNVWQCGFGSSWWAPFSWMAGVLVFVRVICTVVTGICLDVHGRRRVAIVAMGIYAMFAFARSFAPSVEVAIIAIVIEGAAAEAAVMALILITLENSTQKECMRSVCLVLLGHSLAVCAVAAPIHSLVPGQMWTQVAKSAPSGAFIVVLACWLPESVRWVLGNGDWVDAVFLFPKTHNIQLDETMKPKLVAVHRETQRCLSVAGCLGSCVRRSMCPVTSTCLARVCVLGSLCSLLYGLTVGTLLIANTSPYLSIGDRCLAYGASELIVLSLLALVFGRLGARPLVTMTMLALAAATALAALRVTLFPDVTNCGVDVLESLTCHCMSVGAGVALMVSLWRLCPTHSRGALCGLIWSWAVLGFALASPYCDIMDKLRISPMETELKLYVCCGGCLLAAILGLFLPHTPKMLPDALSHLRRRANCNDWSDTYNQDISQFENTRL